MPGQSDHYRGDQALLASRSLEPGLPAVIVVDREHPESCFQGAEFFLLNASVSPFGRFRNSRCVPFKRSTWLVHIVRCSRHSMPCISVRFVPTIPQGVSIILAFR